MKKVFLCVFIFVFLLTGCRNAASPVVDDTQTLDFNDGYMFESTTTKLYGILSCENNADGEADNDNAQQVVQPSDSGALQSYTHTGDALKGEIRGVWLSYYELAVDNTRRSREEYTAYIQSLCEKFRPFGITDAFVHVRPYADAMYKSSVYPTSVYTGVTQGGEAPFDLLEVICQVASAYGIRVHAWVNPYRVHNCADINELSESNKARQWYVEGSAEDVAEVGGKLYFNPASQKAQQLVVEGAREILLNYPVAGIHIDDYFYPPDCGDFDKAQYENYLSQGGSLSLDDWRRSNVNNLISNLYATVKSFGGDRIFSISPAGNINNNYESLYADVSLWSKGGYADVIIPQIYFGFMHRSHPFERCTADWYALKGAGVKMPVGLALYKAGTEDSFAGEGSQEWKQSSDIITRQVQYLRSVGADGFVIFSTEFFLSEDGAAKSELENLKQYLTAY